MLIKGINQFYFNGVRSYNDMGLIVTDTPVISCPERDIEFTSVPGRSGDIIIDKGRYKNITVSYNIAALAEEFRIESQLQKLCAWIASSNGYHKLSDTYNPGYFRIASISGALEITQILRTIGTGTIKFNCKPFKYSFEGQNPIIFTAPGTLYNAEFFSSAPYFKIYGSGTVTLNINNNSLRINNIDEYIEIDFEMINAYKDTILQNNKIIGADMSNIRLVSGNNNISWTGNVEKIEIIPRWCCL